MKKGHRKVALVILIAGIVGCLFGVSDTIIEANAMTGAVRSRIRIAYVFNMPWQTNPTWVDESAERQGISTEAGWQYLSVVSRRPLSTSHACGSAPASFHLNYMGRDELELVTDADEDRFVREFIDADEAKRKQMLSLE